MENESIDWCDACQVCQDKASTVNQECGKEIMFPETKEVIKTIQVPIKSESNTAQTIAISLGFCLIALLIIGYFIWSRMNSIIDSRVGPEVNKKIDDAVKNFTYQAQNDIVKNVVTIRVLRN